MIPGVGPAGFWVANSGGENMEHVRYFPLSHIYDYVTYAAHVRQYSVDVHVIR